MVTYVKLYRYVPNYNPPNYYLSLSNLTAVNNLDTVGEYTSWVECKHSIDNNLGTLFVAPTQFHKIVNGSETDTISNIPSATVVYIKDLTDSRYFFGVVKSVTHESTNVYKLTYTIDWYTSAVISSIVDASRYITPYALTIMYKRTPVGEFNYIDDGFKPVNITQSVIPIKIGTEYLFQQSYINLYYIMVYRDADSDTEHWLLTRYSPETTWDYYTTNKQITKQQQKDFNPNSLTYYGAINLNPIAVPNTTITAGLHLINYTSSSGGEFTSSTERSPTVTFTISVDTPIRSTEYNHIKICDYDGAEILDIPNGVTFSSLSLTASFGFNASSPFIVYKINDPAFKNQMTFSISAKASNVWADSYAIYNAEDRVYHQQMRNLTSLNQLVSGIVDAGNQGAMISAFSRSQGTVPALSKGVTGGGVAAIGSSINYMYETLYANKESQRIEDGQAKVKADTLTMSGGSVPGCLDLAGLWLFSYDSTTVTNITNYQSAFGYATNQIGSNVALNSLSGYVQADILLDTGLRTEIENYIKQMFAYGVRFA